MITLYQFRFSHFCEKARWALDYKGLPYVGKNLLPGLHLKTARRLAPESSLPILVEDGAVVQDSTSIITYLDERYPGRPLTPPDPAVARGALDWEEYFDEEIGVPLRLWFYYHTLPDRRRALGFLLEGAPWYGRPLMALLYPKIRDAMTKAMNIHDAAARQAEARVAAALERLDGALEDRSFLAGSSFSRADLTACALLSPYCAPGKTEAQVIAAMPEPVCAMRDRHRTRRFFGWVLETYGRYRHPGPDVA